MLLDAAMRKPLDDVHFDVHVVRVAGASWHMPKL